MRNIAIILFTWLLSVSSVAQTEQSNQKKWFVGGHIGASSAVADNIKSILAEAGTNVIISRLKWVVELALAIQM